MKIIEEYTNLVKAHLDTLVDPFLKELKSVIDSLPKTGIQLIVFEFDSPCFSDEFSLSIFPCDSTGELAGDAHWFLEGEYVAVPEEIFDNPKYEEIEPWILASEIFENWVIQLWQENITCSYPAYIGHHDTHFKRIMKSGLQTNWDDILKKNQS